MSNKLPQLSSEKLKPTAAHLRDIALVMGCMQRGFLPETPRYWEHGLEVTMRGFSTQEFEVNGEAFRGVVDLVRNNVRLGGSTWPIEDYSGSELLKNVKAWLESRGALVELDEPELSDRVSEFDPEQAKLYAESLWWIDDRLRPLKASLKTGVTSPILLYPHHFDLATSWFPNDDKQQFTIGWSTGDENVAEAYVYVTAYPEVAGFSDIPLPDAAYWQTEGFSGAILPQNALSKSDDPVKVFEIFASLLNTKNL